MSPKQFTLILILNAFLIFSSCGIFSKRSDEHFKTHAPAKKVEIKPEAELATTPGPTTQTPASSLEPTKIEISREKDSPLVSDAKSAPVGEKQFKFSTPALPAETSLHWLQNGNIRFLKKSFRADGRSEKDRARLANGQHPHAIILSCSDSRVPPEIIFDQELGEIFVIRVIGEALDSTVIASIEYAVEHLHAGLLVVLGHSQCGAIQATVKTPENVSTGSLDIDKVISDIRPRLATLKNEPPSSNLEVESTLNADGVARDLVKRSALLRAAVETGNLLIKPALYRIDTGKVRFY